METKNALTTVDGSLRCAHASRFVDALNPGGLVSRVQLALNVSDVDEAVAFYSKLFGAEPAKRKPGYANFAIADPPLKLVLIEGPGGGSLNHLGVETESGDEVAAAEARLRDEGVVTTGVDDTVCCYAAKTETWVTDPDGATWEWYVKTGDAEQMSNQVLADGTTATCCSPAATDEPAAVGAASPGCCG
jgi:catechol 2,3-dioxygenase-like lactoylglutathione lyase family enzyme